MWHKPPISRHIAYEDCARPVAFYRCAAMCPGVSAPRFRCIFFALKSVTFFDNPIPDHKCVIWGQQQVNKREMRNAISFSHAVHHSHWIYTICERPLIPLDLASGELLVSHVLRL